MALSLPVFRDPFFSDIERTFSNLIGPFPGGGVFPPLPPPGALATTTHAFDVTEDENAYRCITDAPGMTPEDVHVELSGDTLTISGQRREEHRTRREEGGMRVHRSERTFSRFSRSFILPDDAQPDSITARMDAGVLTVEIPKLPREARRTEPKRIRVAPGARTPGLITAEPAGAAITSAAATEEGATPGAGAGGPVATAM